MEPPLGVQLPTPVTLATHCLVHSHVLVELMECGHLLSHHVKVSKEINLYFSPNNIISVGCGPLIAPTNGQVDTPSGTTFGSVATFSCNTGYVLSHQQVVMCGVDGMWSPARPSCLGKIIQLLHT